MTQEYCSDQRPSARRSNAQISAVPLSSGGIWLGHRYEKWTFRLQHLKLRHPERSRFSGVARDLAWAEREMCLGEFLTKNHWRCRLTQDPPSGLKGGSSRDDAGLWPESRLTIGVRTWDSPAFFFLYPTCCDNPLASRVCLRSLQSASNIVL